MEHWQRLVILGFSALTVFFLATILLLGTAVDLIVDDGCEIEAVQILPDEKGIHHYNLTLLCEDGSKMMEVYTKDPPPEPGNRLNPIRDSSIIPALSGGVLVIIGLFLATLIALELMPSCPWRRKGNVLKDKLLDEVPEKIEV